MISTNVESRLEGPGMQFILTQMHGTLAEYLAGGDEDCFIAFGRQVVFMCTFVEYAMAFIAQSLALELVSRD